MHFKLIFSTQRVPDAILLLSRPEFSSYELKYFALKYSLGTSLLVPVFSDQIASWKTCQNNKVPTKKGCGVRVQSILITGKLQNSTIEI